MMRKTSLILLGAATGAAMTLLVVQPRTIMIGASASEDHTGLCREQRHCRSRRRAEKY
jgi:hypothetical protein